MNLWVNTQDFFLLVFKISLKDNHLTKHGYGCLMGRISSGGVTARREDRRRPGGPARDCMLLGCTPRSPPLPLGGDCALGLGNWPEALVPVQLREPTGATSDVSEAPFFLL